MKYFRSISLEYTYDKNCGSLKVGIFYLQFHSCEDWERVSMVTPYHPKGVHSAAFPFDYLDPHAAVQKIIHFSVMLTGRGIRIRGKERKAYILLGATPVKCQKKSSLPAKKARR